MDGFIFIRRTMVSWLLVSVIVGPGGYAQISSFFASYDILSTIAGKGGSGDGDANEWDTASEGKPAVEAVLSGPHFAMADSIGNVYIVDKNAHAVRKVDRQGIITTIAGTNVSGDGADGRAVEQPLSFPNGLWVNKKGEYYILDLGNNKIRKVDTTGYMTTLFKDSAGISLGRGLWVSTAEDTIWYASGTAVKMWTAAGGIVTWADGFSALGNIIQDRDGFIVATDRSGHRVYRINQQGTKTVIAGNGTMSGGGDGFPALETGFNEVRGIWFLDDNSYFLATHEGSQVWYIDIQGVAHLFLNGKNGDNNHSGDGENYQTPGIKVSEVRSVTVDYQGNVLLVENDRGFVRKIAKVTSGIITNHAHRSMVKPILQVNRSTGSVILSLRLPESRQIDCNIVTLRGQSVCAPMMYTVNHGVHKVQWESHNLPNGGYYIVVQSGQTCSVMPLFVFH